MGFRDIKSTDGKPLQARERAQLLVVGAGPAGLAAALEAARRGLHVVLVDEHPVDHALMGLDVPFHFGQRMNGAVRNRARMIERIVAADERIAEAFSAGVDVRLGVAVWGLFTHRPGLRWVRQPVAGLTDGEESWFLNFDAIILATGRRDIGLAFPGWALPGVMGVTAAEALLKRYDAFEGQRLVILGSGAEATEFAAAALQAGRRIAAIVEVADQPLEAEACRALAAAGVPIQTGSMISGAFGGTDGVERASVVKLADIGKPDAVMDFACDTVVLAIGTAPTVELFDVVGAEITFVPDRGGHVPTVDAAGRTTVPRVFAAGDCTGIRPAKTRDDRIAAEEGRRAAIAVAAALGDDKRAASQAATDTVASEAAIDVAMIRCAWAAAAIAVADGLTHVCQCEEVSIADLLAVRPPRYLVHDETALRARDIATLAADGPVNQDQIKRLTRAGMGPCQGRRCREQVGAMLACATRTPLAEIPLPSHRAPVRPLPLSALMEGKEAAALADNWEGWFGIKSQWVPFWEPLPQSDDGEAIR